MMNKTDARERACLLLFEMDAKNQSVSDVLMGLEVEPEKYALALLEDYEASLDKIETLISENTKGWKTDRLPGFDRAVLRMAVTELVRSAETPVGTVISESVLLSEKYSTPESPKFINGVLATIAHKVRGVELLQKHAEQDTKKQ